MKYEKLDPALLRVWRTLPGGVEAVRRHCARWGVDIRDGEAWVTVSLWQSTPPDSLQLDPTWRVSLATAFESQHYGEGKASAYVRSARLPLEHLEAVLDHPAVLWMELSHRYRWLNRSRAH